MAQVEFIDGYREIPEYQAELLRGIETFRMTYPAAIAAADRKRVADVANAFQRKLVAESLQRRRM